MRQVVLWAVVLAASAAGNVRMAGAEESVEGPQLDRVRGAEFRLGGVVREYVDAITREWLLGMPDRNPAILEMFADRDRKPYRNLLPWSGEFAGKYLTGAVQVLRLSGDPALKARLQSFVDRLVSLQDADGYLGPFPKDCRLTGQAPNAGGTWDAWGHYHIMLGLLLWHEDTGDAKALGCATRIGDLLCGKFLGTGRAVASMGSVEMNHAVVHSLCLLYRATRTPRYLDLARQIVREFESKAPDGSAAAGEYLGNALAGREFFQCPKPRWESLHAIMGLAELAWLTGEADGRKAFERTWWSIAKLDRHNNGGFSSGEQAQGNPYHGGAIETCCTVAWIALSVEMLRMSGRSVVADEIELATLNSVMGYQSRTGKWCTYSTPMDGVRKPSTEEIAFQKRPGSEEVNCCSANGPRGFGMISDWALMTDGRALVLNGYGPSVMTARVGEVRVTLKQETAYPRDGRIRLEVVPDRAAALPLRLRIPHWSERTRVAVNGVDVPGVRAGTYLTLERSWAPGDTVEIDLDMRLHYWAGERECAGRTSIYRGPLLLAYRLGAPVPIRFSPQWKQYGDLWACNEVGAYLEYTFEGTGVRWEGRRFDDAGRARVTIDGKEVVAVDQYDPKRGVPFSWEHRGLERGTHTIRITILDEKDKRSRDRFANITVFADPDAPRDASPVLDAAAMGERVVDSGGETRPILLLEVADADGRKVRLQDFATAGEGGARYLSWLNVRNVRPGAFSEANPLRSTRATGE